MAWKIIKPDHHGREKKTDSGSLWLISNRLQSSPPPCKACWESLLASGTIEKLVTYRWNKEQQSKAEQSLPALGFPVHVALLRGDPCDGYRKGGALLPEARQLCLQAAEAAGLDSHAHGPDRPAAPLLHRADLFAAGDLADAHSQHHPGNKGESFSSFKISCYVFSIYFCLNLRFMTVNTVCVCGGEGGSAALVCNKKQVCLGKDKRLFEQEQLLNHVYSHKFPPASSAGLHRRRNLRQML